MQIATFTNKMENYKYMKLPNSNEADVFIYRFKEESIDEDGNKSYIYDFNEFRTSKLSEEDIKKDPFNYLEYSEKVLTDKEKIADLTRKVNDLTSEVEKLKLNSNN